jgi:hypothetical protein
MCVSPRAQKESASSVDAAVNKSARGKSDVCIFFD